MIYVRPDVQHLFAGEKSVADFLRIDFEVFKQIQNRRTGRFVRGGRGFFIKVHQPLGWQPIAEQFLKFRVPQIGALAERQALEALADLGVSAPRVVAFGEQGNSPASRQSFLITEEVAPAISLEKLAQESATRPISAKFRRELVRELANIARTLHTNGINHRDFYLAHFLLDLSGGHDAAMNRRPRLHVIDLHRAQLRKTTPQRWIVKDLGGLLFSAMDAGIRPRDLALFVRVYAGRSYQQEIAENAAFWQAVRRCAEKLYRKVHKRAPSAVLWSAASQRSFDCESAKAA